MSGDHRHISDSQASIEGAMQTARERHRIGERAGAETLCRQILAEQPAHAGALQLLGILAGEAGQTGLAIELIFRAIRRQPENPELRLNLGVALQSAGRSSEAVAAHEEAARLAPHLGEVQFRLGVAYQTAGRLAEAVTAYRETLRIDSTRAQAGNNLGAAYEAMGQPDDAIAAYRKSVELEPRLTSAHYNLGKILLAKANVDEATESFECAIRLDPNHAAAHNGLGNCHKERGRIDEALNHYRAAAKLDPKKSDWLSNIVYTMHFQEGCRPSDILEEAMKWDVQFGRPEKADWRSHGSDFDPDRRLRIGFVSPDFNRHVVGRSIAPLLRALDRARCEIFCYSDVGFQDSVTERIRLTAEHWRDLRGISDEKAEEMIRADGIDVLIDLTAHMAHNRLRLFARKPAPVQATYLGYCSTTGLEAMDYRLSDPYLDSPNDDATLHECYRERTIRLPRSYWCYEPSGPTPEISELPALGNGSVTFACLNNFAKASPDALAAWMEILQQAKESKLILHASEGKTRAEIRGVAERRGIEPVRLEFVGMKSWEEYMKSYGRVDIGLDPYPYNGGITTLDALWMGVPVISLSGCLAVGRGGLSILTNAGLPELATKNRDDYVSTAVGLAEDLSRLRQLRETLREKMERSPLRDVKGFARDFEAVCRSIWQNRCGERD